MRQYLNLVQDVLENGEVRKDRTGTGVVSLFGTQTRYNLQTGFPLLTTKKVNFEAIKAELFWFLRGETNVNSLRPVKIWDAWADETGELGPIYGYAWRNWNGQGIDQIQNAINLIKTNPTSRRIIVSAWNVADIERMALPPCHLLFQFRVGGDRMNKLDCQLYQRSADLALGVPFNIASYALLTEMIAKECGLEARHLIHTIGDAHVYLNHIDGIEKQLERTPTTKPRINLADLSFDEMIQAGPTCVTIHDYNPAPSIKFEVSV